MRLRGRKRIVAGVLLVLIALVYFGSAPLLRRAGNFLIVDEKPRQADAIVVLAGGDPARPQPKSVHPLSRPVIFLRIK